MPAPRWSAPWQDFPPSRPLPVEGGLASSKKRGAAMADTWWSKRFVDVLESYGLGGRMQRGRRYARAGQVVNLNVGTGLIAARVQGSRRTPYAVGINLASPRREQWSAIEEAMAAKVGFAARLLAGELPPDLENVFNGAGVPLFPRTWRELRTECSCPDWGNPCKHIAAVLYVFADRLDADPWLLLAWRGRTRDEILAPLRASADAYSATRDYATAEVAPWWPFVGGPLPSVSDTPSALDAHPPDIDAPDAVLARLEELDVVVAGTPFRDLIRAAYERLTE